ncbi:MAG: EF-hand domain-containing protein [archaeon]|nr:EF-hand domain-containing protein [archaeon]
MEQFYKERTFEESKRASSAYPFNGNPGNFNTTRFSQTRASKRTFQPSEEEIQRDINRIKVVLNYLTKKGKKMISYLELISIFQAYSLSFNKIQMMGILKFLGIENPNCFNFNDFLYRIKKTTFIKPNYDVTIQQIKAGINEIAEAIRNAGGEDYFFKDEEEISYDVFNQRLKGKICLPQKVIDAIFDYLTNKRKTNLTKEIFRNNLTLAAYYNPYDANFDINSMKVIVNRMTELELRSDSYFDHLLHYNICRYQNELNPEEFQRVMELEGFNFNEKEMKAIFKYIDYKGDNSIDREEWNKALNKIPHPIINIQNFIRNKKYNIETIAYKMDINLFDPNHESVMNQHIPKNIFKNKMRQLDEHLQNDFIYSLFDAISGGKKDYVTPAEIFKHFNIYKLDIYSNINVDDVIRRVKTSVQNSLLFDDFIKIMQKEDKRMTGRLPLDKFTTMVINLTKGKVNREDLLRFSRIFHKLDLNDEIFYHELANILYEGAPVDNFQKCIQFLKKFLKEDCNNDLFLFFVKMNNMNNSAGMNKNLNINKVYEFFRGHVDMLHPSTINKFDLDGDGVINFEDMTNIIKLYIDKEFFDDKKKIQMENSETKRNIAFEHFKKINTEMMAAISSINMTIHELFSFLDSDKDGYISKEEFLRQFQRLPLNKTMTQKEMSDFYDYLDIYCNSKLDIQTFLNQIRTFKDEKEIIYKGNFITEFTLLKEFTEWYLRNNNLSDTEVFSILDNDHDGIISLKDIKVFALRSLVMNKNELTDMNVRRFMNAISLSKDGNISLADIRNLMKNANFGQMDHYYNSMKQMCNKGVSKYNKDKNWLEEVTDRIGMFINERFPTVGAFFDSVNDGMKDINLKNFRKFLDQNPKILYGFNLTDKEIGVLFSTLSQSKSGITATDLLKFFPVGKYDFYSQMHNDIFEFLNTNFRNSRDAFKYFHRVQPEENYAPTTDKSSEIPAVTKKEFFRAINYLFPQKYSTEAILKYIRDTFPGIEENGIITFSEFTSVYFEKIRYNETFTKTFFKPSKILTDRQEIFSPLTTFNSPFFTKDHPKLKTPFDNDALKKVKKLIASSKTEYRTVFEEYIPKSKGGYVNVFEFRNLIKKFDLGLTNIEIEDIINHSGMTRNGYINLYDFLYYLSNDDKNTIISKENILNQLKEYKQLIYKYYTNPRLAFSLNDMEIKSTIDFDKFKKIILDIYKRDFKTPPNYAVLKCTYDFIDIRKDGVIDLNEWNKVFATSEGILDASANKNQMNILRKWETSNDIIGIYKIIAKNKKIIRNKVKMVSFGAGSSGMVIQSNNLIRILQEVLKGIVLSQTQWKMLVAIGDRDKSGLIDFEAFMNVIDTSVRMIKSHPLPRFT